MLWGFVRAVSCGSWIAVFTRLTKAIHELHEITRKAFSLAQS